MKQIVRVPIDDELREALAMAYEAIQAADLDPDEGALSEDLIQWEGLVGGLQDDGRYWFSYTRSSETKLEFALFDNEIESIAENRSDEITTWQCTDPACGRYHATKRTRCFYCDSTH